MFINKDIDILEIYFYVFFFIQVFGVKGCIKDIDRDGDIFVIFGNNIWIFSFVCILFLKNEDDVVEIFVILVKILII